MYADTIMKTPNTHLTKNSEITTLRELWRIMQVGEQYGTCELKCSYAFMRIKGMNLRVAMHIMCKYGDKLHCGYLWES